MTAYTGWRRPWATWESVCETAPHLLALLRVVQHGLDVQLSLPRTMPLLSTDPEHLRQILQDLLHNAAKFGESGSLAVCRRAHPSRAAGHTVFLTIARR